MRTRLLIVDADSILRLDLRQLLQALGYEVVGAAGGGAWALPLLSRWASRAFAKGLR